MSVVLPILMEEIFHQFNPNDTFHLSSLTPRLLVGDNYKPVSHSMLGLGTFNDYQDTTRVLKELVVYRKI